MEYAMIDYMDRKWSYILKFRSDVDKLSVFLPRFNERYSERYAKRVLNILNKFKINVVVLNNELLKNNVFCKTLLSQKKSIVTGRKIYKALILRVLKDVSKQMNVGLEKLKVVYLIDEYSLENVDLIRWTSKKVKSLTVVTSDKDKFTRLSEELYENFGIILKLCEKNRTNYKYADVLVNIDFSSLDMEKICMASNSLIICGFACSYKVRPNFSGVLIRKIDVISPGSDSPLFDELALCEARIYSYLRKLKENDRVFEMNGYRINGYFGENGKIMSEDFRKLGKIILDK